MAQALHYEVKDKIDVLSWLPGHVDTKLPANHRSGCSNTISSYQAIEGMLRDLGKESKTFGHRNHWFGSATLECLPMSLLGTKFAKIFERIFNEQEAKKQKEAQNDVEQ